jgi:hypothetical protein
MGMGTSSKITNYAQELQGRVELLKCPNLYIKDVLYVNNRYTKRIVKESHVLNC